VSAYRDLGYLPETMVNFLALLGWSLDGQREIFTLAELEQAFRLERVGSNPAIFNNEKLEWMNGQHLRALSEGDRVERVTRFLESRGRSLAGHTPEWRAALVRAMGDRLKTLADAEIYGAFALDEKIEMEHVAWSELLAKPDVGPRLGRIAREIESDSEFSLASLERITRELCAKLGIKAGELIGVMRVALTGRKVSPGIFDVIWLLGKDRAVARLDAAAERWSEEKKSAPV
jgi:glutamyl-tRNA synthetase